MNAFAISDMTENMPTNTFCALSAVAGIDLELSFVLPELYCIGFVDCRFLVGEKCGDNNTLTTAATLSYNPMKTSLQM
jgi:hypothetical protein